MRTMVTERPAIDGEQRGWHPVDLFSLAWRQRYLFGGTIAIIVGATIVYLLIATPEFTSHATFMAPPDEQGGLSGLLRDPINLALRMRGSSASLDRLSAFLDSETARRSLVRRFDLARHYRSDLESEAMTQLEYATSVATSVDGVTSVMVTDRDRRLAAALANAYIDIADSLFRRSEAKHATQKREFLEIRVAGNRDDLAAAEEEARAFSRRYGVIALPNQVAALIDQMSEVEANLRTLDVKIGAARQILGPNHYTVREMEVERAQLASEKRRLVTTGGGEADPLLAFRDVPDRALEYARLEREVRIQSLIQQLLLQQFEVAKIEEVRDVSSLTRIDTATPPDRKSSPRRLRLLVISGVMAVVWAFLLAALAEAWPDLRRRFAGRVPTG